MGWHQGGHRALLSLSSHFWSSGVLLLGTVVAGVLSYVSVALGARLLGTADFGLLGALLGLINLVSVGLRPVHIMATHLAATAYAQRDLRLIRGVVGPTIVIGVAAVLVTLPAVLLAREPLESFLQTNNFWPLAVVALIIGALIAVQSTTGLVSGIQRFWIMALANVADALIRAGVTVPLVLSVGVTGALGSYLAGMLVTSAICIAGIGGIAWRIPAREHLRDSLQVGGSTLTLTVAGALVQNSELVLLRSYAQPDEVGLYAAAASIGNTLYVLCAPLYIPAFPRTVTAYAEGKPTWPILRDVLVLIVGVGLLAEFGAILLGGAAAQLVFGPSFNRVGTYLPIYIAKTIALLLLGTVGQYAIALARSQITYVAAGIAFLGPLLVLVFRPEVLVAAVDMFAAAATASAAILGLLALRRGGTRA